MKIEKMKWLFQSNKVRRMVPISPGTIISLMGLQDAHGSAPCKINPDGSLNIMFRQLTWANPFVLDNAVVLGWTLIVWLLVFTVMSSWLIFGCIYYIFEVYAGTTCDLGTDSGCKLDETENMSLRCVLGLYDYSAAVQFSLETMTTIGYGTRALQAGHKRCYLVMLGVIFQSLTGLLLIGILTGVLMAKFKTWTNKKNPVMFSPKAGIISRRGKLQLLVEVHSHNRIYNASVDAFIVMEDVTREGNFINNSVKCVHFGMENSSDANENFVHVMWPICLSHEINEYSPLFKYRPDDKSFNDFELILVLQGTTSLGGDILIRTSYIKSEIEWGSRFKFENVLSERPPTYNVMVNESALHQMEHTSLEKVSAYELWQKKMEEDKNLGIEISLDEI